MIEKNKKTIIFMRVEVYILNITQNEIEVYLAEVKEAIQNNRYRIEKTFVDRAI